MFRIAWIEGACGWWKRVVGRSACPSAGAWDQVTERPCYNALGDDDPSRRAVNRTLGKKWNYGNDEGGGRRSFRHTMTQHTTITTR